MFIKTAQRPIVKVNRRTETRTKSAMRIPWAGSAPSKLKTPPEKSSFNPILPGRKRKILASSMVQVNAKSVIKGMLKSRTEAIK